MADWKNVHLAEQDSEIAALRAQVECLTQMQANDAATAAEAVMECGKLRAQVEELKLLLRGAEAESNELDELVGRGPQHRDTVEAVREFVQQAESRATRAEADLASVKVERDEARGEASRLSERLSRFELDDAARELQAAIDEMG